jgi:hypothetical protein
MPKLSFKKVKENYEIYEGEKCIGYISCWDEFKEWRSAMAEDTTESVLMHLQIAEFILTIKEKGK